MATTRQMSYLRKLYYKSDEINYESYDLFDESNKDLIDQMDASALINYMTDENNKHTYKQQAHEIINNLESAVGGENNDK